MHAFNSCAPYEVGVLKFAECMQVNEPCLIDNVTVGGAVSKWVKGDSLDVERIVREYGSCQVPIVGARCEECFASGQEASEAVAETADCFNARLSDYFGCWRKHRPLCGYLKDWHGALEHKRLFGADSVLYDTPVYFMDDWLNGYLDLHGNQDYRFVYCGPQGSKTGLHHDVFLSFSWSLNVVGTKLWILYPPEQKQYISGVQSVPGLDDKVISWFRAGQDMTALENIVKDSSSKHPQLHKTNPIVIVQKAGQAIFVPTNWFHQVHNLEDTLSINHNWFNRHNLTQVHEHLVKEHKATKFALRDCRNPDLQPEEDTEWLDIVENIMKLNTGINMSEWKELLKWKAETTQNNLDQAAIQLLGIL
mmetsp:Transcript_366/g.669  ORF Transcript_366/g.669 Transcript_366/m.669 type:complete len:363 (-) Transcript_366:280-1368(-)